MTERTVSVRLKAEVAGYIAPMKEAGAATRGLAADVAKASAAQKRAMQDVGRATTVGGLAIVGGLGLATKAAMSWETAWTGVTKTVDGSTKQMAALEEGLRGLATTLPATHEEIAGVAEAAGQLGVARSSIVSFTKTMIDLGETTNLTADEAATSIAQMANVMGTAPDEISRLGSTLVALGNDGASTERQIIQMAQRISGAAAVVGLSEGEVLAFANTVASMGIEVESGGTSVSRVITDMSRAAQNGGKELDVFAKTAGMSAEQFATAFQEAPAEAFASFIEGLAGVKEAGGNVFAVLDDLGLSDVRVSQAILGMASSGDLLRDSLDLQATAWRDNTALVEEATKRYATAESRIQVARNQINDAAIDIGGTLLPAVAEGAESVAGLASAFADLPDPVKESATAFTAMGGAAALGVGGLMLMLPRIADTRQALKDLDKAGLSASSRLRGLGAAAGVAAIGVPIATGAFESLHEVLATKLGNDAPKVTALTESLVDFAQQGRVTGELAATFGSDMSGFDAALGGLTGASGKISGFVNGLDSIVLPLKALPDLNESATNSFTSLDQSLAALATSGNGDVAAQLFEKYSARAEAAGVSVDDLKAQLPEYSTALAAASTEQKLAGDTAATAAGALSGLGDEAALTEEDVDALKRAYSGLNELLSDDSAEINYQQALDDLSESFEGLNRKQRESAKALNTHTQSGRDAKNALIGLITSANDHAQAVLDESGSVDKANGVLGRHRNEIAATAKRLGLNREQVARLMKALQDFDGTHARSSVDVTGAASAILSLQTLSAMVRQLDGKTFRITGTYSAGAALNQYLAQKKAIGGHVVGPGGPTSDSIPAYLSNGEYVMKTAAVDKYGVKFFDELNAMRLAAGGHAIPGASHSSLYLAAGGAPRVSAAARHAASLDAEARSLAARLADQLGAELASGITDALAGYLRDGVVDALTGSAADVTGAGERLAGLLDDAFAKRTANRDDLLGRLQDGNERITDLVERRAEQVKKIGEIQREGRAKLAELEDDLGDVKAGKGKGGAAAAAKKRSDIRRDIAKTKAETAKDIRAARADLAEITGDLTDARTAAAKVRDAIDVLDRMPDAVRDASAMSTLKASLAEQATVLEGLAAQRSDLAEQIKDATTDLADAVRLRDDFARSVSSSLLTFGSLTSAQGGVVNQAQVSALTARLDQAKAAEADAERRFQLIEASSLVVTGDLVDAQNKLAAAKRATAAASDDLTEAQKGEALSSALIVRTRRERLAAAQDFLANVKTLRAMGLNPADLQDIVSKGAEGGGAYAASLVAGGANDIAALNDLQVYLSQTAGELGATTSGWFYQAGVDSKQALLNGLTAQDSTLAAAAQTFAAALIHEMQTALEIRSPSHRVYREVAQYVPAAFGQAFRDAAPALSAQLQALVAMPTVPRYAPMRASAYSGGGAQAQGAGGMPSTLVVVDADGALIGRMRVEADRAVDGQHQLVADSLVYGRTEV